MIKVQFDKNEFFKVSKVFREVFDAVFREMEVREVGQLGKARRKVFKMVLCGVEDCELLQIDNGLEGTGQTSTRSGGFGIRTKFIRLLTNYCEFKLQSSCIWELHSYTSYQW